MQKRKVRSLFLSDIHLANPNSQVKRLSEFLDSIETDHLFLLGDIVDLWKLSNRKGRWYREHEKVLKQLLDFSKRGARVMYVPGNHDPFFRYFNGNNLGPVEVQEEYIHTTEAGQRILLIHGDRFDKELYQGDLLHFVGEFLYEGIVSMNRYINVVRGWFGRPYWSLSCALKMNSKKARSYIDRFEQKAVDYAKSQQADGVVCGHIHQSKLTMKDGIMYANDGDWVESCSALVENFDGSFEIISVAPVALEQRLLQLAS